MKMKIINLPRTAGKTRRCLYYSEEHQIPILCYNTYHKQLLIDGAKCIGINIPTPLCIEELNQTKSNKIIIDEVIMSLQEFINKECGKSVEITHITLSDEENLKKCRTFHVGDYKDEDIDERLKNL